MLRHRTTQDKILYSFGAYLYFLHLALFNQNRELTHTIH